MQLGVENEKGLVNQVNQASADYAKDRSAEMVGKKWVDGKLVDNPDAEWVITDPTRDAVNGLISDVMTGKMDATDLPKAIMDADTFSKERANMIARTELITAHGNGTLEGFKAAKSIGVNVKKAWLPDDGACDICLDNADDGAIDVDDEFSSGDDCPAAHPNCECSIIAEVDGEENESDDESESDDD